MSYISTSHERVTSRIAGLPTSGSLSLTHTHAHTHVHTSTHSRSPINRVTHPYSESCHAYEGVMSQVCRQVILSTKSILRSHVAATRGVMSQRQVILSTKSSHVAGHDSVKSFCRQVILSTKSIFFPTTPLIQCATSHKWTSHVAI